MAGSCGGGIIILHGSGVGNGNSEGAEREVGQHGYFLIRVIV